MTAPSLSASPAATTAAGPGPFTVLLPAGLPLINSNQRIHHHMRAQRTRLIRDAAHQATTEHAELMTALTAATPGALFGRAHVLGILHPPSNRRADPANWYPSFKAAIDGLVDAGLLDDDDHEHLVGPDIRLREKRKGGQLTLIISGLRPGEDPLGVTG
ncbi:hypothetical protein [Streptomyces sp. NPDC058045]|uniref:hypothetical protein n=1 Tax=Streptomyces sp. NPDC058045 TaxID=3346311 RepID=UPI0036E9B69E